MGKLKTQFLSALRDSRFQLITPKVAYGIPNSGKSSKPEFISLSSDGDQNGREGSVPFVNGFAVLVDHYDEFGTQRKGGDPSAALQSDSSRTRARKAVLRGSMWL